MKSHTIIPSVFEGMLVLLLERLFVKAQLGFREMLRCSDIHFSPPFSDAVTEVIFANIISNVWAAV